MKKYDCNKTIDFIHELNRACKMYKRCDLGCPLKEHSCTTMGGITQESIDALQKWSDENPEAPKLSKRDRAFLEAFDMRGVDRTIRKDCLGNVYYVYGGIGSRLASGMFESLEADTTMTFEELLNMDTEEEE